MQQIEFAFLVEIAGQDQLSGLAEFCDPCRVSRTKLFFKLLPDLLRQRWTLPGSRYGNLQIAAAHHRGIEEIAEIGNIDHIAEHAPSPRFVVDALIQAPRIRGDDG